MSKLSDMGNEHTALLLLEDWKHSWDCYDALKHNSLSAEILHRLREYDRLKAEYSELIMAVQNKYPDESRHETALRLILTSGISHDGDMQQSKPTTKEE